MYSLQSRCGEWRATRLPHQPCKEDSTYVLIYQMRKNPREKKYCAKHHRAMRRGARILSDSKSKLISGDRTHNSGCLWWEGTDWKEAGGNFLEYGKCSMCWLVVTQVHTFDKTYQTIYLKAVLGIPWWSSGEGTGFFPGQGNKIRQAARCSHNK